MSDDDIYIWARATGDLLGSFHVPDSSWTLSAAFVPGHDEILVERGRSLALWSVHDQRVRTIELGSSYSYAVSPDGKRLALVLADGRTALVDLDVVRGAVPATPVVASSPPKTCPGGDPIASPPPDPDPLPSEENGP